MAGRDIAIADLEALFGLTFRNGHLLWQALQQAGAGNKRLAQVGDAAASLSLWIQWFPTNQSRGEGDTRRQRHLNNANLARRGRALGIDRLMVCNDGTTSISDAMIATTMEALIGAAYCDGEINLVAQMLSVMDLGSGLDAM